MHAKRMTIFDRAEKNLLSDFRSEHSEFQLMNFVIPGAGGVWEKYRQALRELNARHRKIKDEISDIISLKNEITKTEKKRPRFFYNSKIKILKTKLESTIEAHKPRMREYCTIYGAAIKLKRKLGEITPQKRRELEAEMWVEKARRMAAIDLISIGGLQRSTVEFITSFPVELRRKIFSDLRPENRQKLLSILD